METSQSSFRADRYWQIFQRHRIPTVAVFLAISTWGVISTAIKPDIYEAEGKLKFQKSNVNSSLTDVSHEFKVLAPVTDDNNLIATEAEVIKSNSVIEKTINDLQLKDRQGNPLKISNFCDKLNVSVISNTNVLRISYQDPDPQISKEVVNKLIANYLESNLIANKNEALEIRNFLEEQIPKAQQALLDTETSIKELKTKKQILLPQEEASKLATNLGDLEKRITEARSEIINLNSQSKYLKEQLTMNAQQVLSATELTQSPAIEQIIAQLQELELQLNQEQNRFSENNPQTIKLQEKIRLQRELLAKQVKKVTDSQQEFSSSPQFGEIQEELTVEIIKLESNTIGLTQQVAYLAEIEKKLRQKAANLPEVEHQLTHLERELGVSQRTYELLQNQLNLIEIVTHQNLGNVRIISYATTPNTPISSSSLAYLSAISLGLISAAGVVYLLEAQDSYLRTIKEAKQLFGYNWLGIIPSFNKTELSAIAESDNWSTPPLIVRDDPGSSVSESYRMLQSNLRSLNSDRQIQTIVVTSGVSGEGKSTVAANLAGAMAQVGHKVLLVDADLHSPVQKNIWDTEGDYGLSDLLADNLDYRLVTETAMDNLSIISSGTISQSPGNLLDSYRMKDLMHYWSRVYDFVIIDSPSLDKAADAPILGRMADGVLLVVKPEEINRSQAEFAKETLEHSGQNVLGIVFNNINPKVDAGGHHYHSLEKEHDVLPQAQLSSGSEEEFWDTIIGISQKSPKLQLSSTINPQQLLDTPVDRLEDTINHLEQDLAELTALVQEQEDELLMKSQTVRELRRNVKLASIPERFSLEEELAQEQEIKQMLEKTLRGQRRNLARKRQIICQYQEIIQVKQT